MKMPEPIATVTDNFATDFSEISRTWQRPIPLGTKLYDKQALIDLLEAAINSYSPDDTAMDYINKLIAMKETL